MLEFNPRYNIDGGEELFKLYGYFPTFHDDEVVQFKWGYEEFEIYIKAQTRPKGYKKKDLMIKMTFKNIKKFDISLSENFFIIGGIEFSKDNSLIVSDIWGSVGIGGKIACERIIIEPYVRDEMNSNVRDVLDFYSHLSDNEIVCIPRFLEENNSKEMVYLRLERAAIDNCEPSCCATYSRYAIWSESIRFIIMQAKIELQNGNIENANNFLNIAGNSIGAYIDIQTMLDSGLDGTQFKKPKDVKKSYLRYLKKT